MQCCQVVCYRHTWKRGGGIRRTTSSPLVVFIRAGVFTHLNCFEREELGVEGE